MNAQTGAGTSPSTALGHHPLTQGLRRQPIPVHLGQLLARQSRTKVRIAFLHPSHNLPAQSGSNAWLERLPRRFETKPAAPGFLIPAQQPLDLPNTHTQLLRPLALPKTPRRNLPNNRKAIRLPDAHQYMLLGQNPSPPSRYKGDLCTSTKGDIWYFGERGHYNFGLTVSYCPGSWQEMIQTAPAGWPASQIHAQVLAAAQQLCSPLDWTFRLVEVVRALPHLNESSIRTHVVSRCCVNAPQNHAHRWPYFRRVDRGVYEILPEFRRTPPAGAPVREGVGRRSQAYEAMPGRNEEYAATRMVIHAAVVESEGWYVPSVWRPPWLLRVEPWMKYWQICEPRWNCNLDRQELARLACASAAPYRQL